MRFSYWRYRYDTTDLLTAAAAGVVLGALAMFIFDPEQGRRRRALARDKLVHYGRRAGDMVSGTETRSAVQETIGSNDPEATRPPF